MKSDRFNPLYLITTVGENLVTAVEMQPQEFETLLVFPLDYLGKLLHNVYQL